MATQEKNLNVYTPLNIYPLPHARIVILVAEWNPAITDALYQGAYETLIAEGIQATNIERQDIPGSFELTLAADWAAARMDVDAVIAIGCIIQGETRHFDFIAQAVAIGLTNVNLQYKKPVVFGVLTPDTKEQALDRAGGIHGNKGIEAAAAALKMLGIKYRPNA